MSRAIESVHVAQGSFPSTSQCVRNREFRRRYAPLRSQFRDLQLESGRLLYGSPQYLSVIPRQRKPRIGRESVDFWGVRWKFRVRASDGSREQDGGDSTENKGEVQPTDGGGVGQSASPSGQSSSSSSSSTSSSSRGEKTWKSVWWKRGKWKWQPILQVQEMGVLLLQLGIVIFAIRLLRPGFPLPGTSPRVPVTYVSVPFSDFLSKIGNNQVKKVEVDGVHIMFRLRSDEQVADKDLSGNVNARETEEALIKNVGLAKRVVYSTTRPADIKTPYEKMLDNDVEFGSPDKRSGGFLNSALVIRLSI